MTGSNIIRLANLSDMPYLMWEAMGLFAESNFNGKLTFSPHNTSESFYEMLQCDSYIILIASKDGVDCGFCIWAIDKSWTLEGIAIEVLFYINPEYRGGQISKMLLQESIKMCDNKGVVFMYSSSTAGFKDGGINARAYNMLFGSCGFSVMPQSNFLIREM
jgi:GNAT superfamily N-acetyltransferase